MTMKLGALILTAVVLGWPLHAGAADPGTTGTAPSALEQPVPPPATAPVVVEKPRPVEPPKPVAKPRPVVEQPAPVPPPLPVAAKPEEAPVPPPMPVEPASQPEVAVAATAAGGGLSVGCGLLAFAMLIIGFAAGFVGRHFWSRRQLGGMTVRIGTWRGIP